MKIEFDNLSQPVGDSVDEDLRVVAREARRRGVRMPDIAVRIVSLESGSIPANLPRHAVKRPAAGVPPSFAARCDWETRRQSFQFVRDGKAAWIIAGGEEGALYGFDELLERLLGVLWAGIGDEHILFGTRRPLPRGVQSPSFAFRVRDGSPPPGYRNEDFLKWLSRNRYNARVQSSREWARRSPEQNREYIRLYRSRGMHIIVGYHSMEYFLPPEEFARHPEWFGMRDGRRTLKAVAVLPECPHLHDELSVQPCYSNPEAVDAITDKMAAQIREYPEIEIFSVWPHDGINNWCQCPQCVKRTPYEQMYAVAYALQRKTPRHLPIELIAYANLLTPPWSELPRSDRIISMLCPYLRPYKHRIYDQGGAELVMSTLYPAPDRVNPGDDRDYGKLFRQWEPVWRRNGSTPGIFEYGGVYWPDESRRINSRFGYHPPAWLRFDEARWYRDRGVRYMYMCSIYNGWPDTFHLLAEARAMWEADGSASELAGRYYRALAGRVGTSLRGALEAVAEELRFQRDPARPLARLDALLAALAPEAFVKRYQAWSRYVRMASNGWSEETAGDHKKAIEWEARIQAFLKRLGKKLEEVLDPRFPIGYSRTKVARLKEWYPEVCDSSGPAETRSRLFI